jgi:HK97 family phage prohead protease
MKQVRFIPNGVCGLQVREPMEGQSESRVVEGKPIIFGVRSVNLTPWSPTRKVYEVLEPGCITNELLMRSDVILNINHSTKVTDVLGRCNNGKGTLSLELRERYVGSDCALPHTNAANDTLELIKRGDISGMSFAFDDDWEDTENGVSLERTSEIEDGKEVWIKHVKRITALYDVSIVTHPAYEQTSVATREQSDAIDKAIEAQLKREAGEQETDEQRKEREAAEAAAKAEQERKEREAAEAKAKEEKELRERMQTAKSLRSRNKQAIMNFSY